MIEGNQLSISKYSSIELIREGLISLPKWIKRSYFTKKGYLDGINGFKAAFIYGFYISAIYWYALYKRIVSKYVSKFFSLHPLSS